MHGYLCIARARVENEIRSRGKATAERPTGFGCDSLPAAQFFLVDAKLTRPCRAFSPQTDMLARILGVRWRSGCGQCLIFGSGCHKSVCSCRYPELTHSQVG